GSIVIVCNNLSISVPSSDDSALDDETFFFTRIYRLQLDGGGIWDMLWAIPEDVSRFDCNLSVAPNRGGELPELIYCDQESDGTIRSRLGQGPRAFDGEIYIDEHCEVGGITLLPDTYACCFADVPPYSYAGFILDLSND
ncbi:hypothetical protein FOL46_005072, partial [Perkinsus olseni]